MYTATPLLTLFLLLTINWQIKNAGAQTTAEVPITTTVETTTAMSDSSTTIDPVTDTAATAMTTTGAATPELSTMMNTLVATNAVNIDCTGFRNALTFATDKTLQVNYPIAIDAVKAVNETWYYDLANTFGYKASTATTENTGANLVSWMNTVKPRIPVDTYNTLFNSQISQWNNRSFGDLLTCIQKEIISVPGWKPCTDTAILAQQSVIRESLYLFCQHDFFKCDNQTLVNDLNRMAANPAIAASSVDVAAAQKFLRETFGDDMVIAAQIPLKYWPGTIADFLKCELSP